MIDLVTRDIIIITIMQIYEQEVKLMIVGWKLGKYKMLRKVYMLPNKRSTMRSYGSAVVRHISVNHQLSA